MDLVLEENLYVYVTLEKDNGEIYNLKNEHFSRSDFEEFYGMLTDRLVYLKVGEMAELPEKMGEEESFWIVDIVSMNKDGKLSNSRCECRNLTDLSSLVLNYRGKRGYVPIKYDIVKGEVLV